MIRTFQALAALLTYPEAGLTAAVDELRSALRQERLISASALAEIERLFGDLASADLLDLQERYVALFDRRPSLSLHLFQHVHGDSRERGQAMVDLQTLYRRHGLEIGTGELPDFLPLYLEFLAHRPVAEAQTMLADVGHILAQLYARLATRTTPYAAPIGALLDMAGVERDSLPEADEGDADSLEALDRAWEDQEIRFTANDGQNAGGCTKAADMVRRMRMPEGATS
jgi:nitrate reductase delta subunit